MNVKLVSVPRAFVLKQLDFPNWDLVLNLASKTEHNWPPAHTRKECCFWKLLSSQLDKLQIWFLSFDLFQFGKKHGGLSICFTNHAKCIGVRNRIRKAVLQLPRPSHTLLSLLPAWPRPLFLPPNIPWLGDSSRARLCDHQCYELLTSLWGRRSASLIFQINLK